MKLFRTPAEMRAWTRAERAAGRTIGLVPTMGALHEGHRSLIRAAVAENDAAVVSIFVNPAQFGPAEDLDAYPRTFEADRAECEALGAAAIYAPTPAAMYPEGYATYIEVQGLQDHLCGKSRPVFFRGIATVVAKLFNAAEPDRAYFGQKDAQQAAIIRRLIVDLDYPIELRVLPIVRESDGLAMSSRNQYLSAEERARAVCMSRGVAEGRRRMEAGERDPAAVAAAVREHLTPADEIDYVELVDAETIQPLDRIAGSVLLAAAARIGRTRLIDNATYEAER